MKSENLKVLEVVDCGEITDQHLEEIISQLDKMVSSLFKSLNSTEFIEWYRVEKRRRMLHILYEASKELKKL